MKKIIFYITGILMLPVTLGFAQSKITDEYVNHSIENGRKYIFAIFKPGPNQSLNEDSVANEQMAHLKYLFTLQEEGKVSIFGPFFNEENLDGICIFNSTSKEEVRKLVENDPHIKSVYLVYELRVWFGIPGQSLTN